VRTRVSPGMTSRFGGLQAAYVRYCPLSTGGRRYVHSILVKLVPSAIADHRRVRAVLAYLEVR
jgi:hypothetical protein